MKQRMARSQPRIFGIYQVIPYPIGRTLTRPRLLGTIRSVTHCWSNKL